MTLVLLNISPYPPSQALLALSSLTVVVAVLLHTRSRAELWARRIKQASVFNMVVASGIALFVVTSVLYPRLLPIVHLMEEFGIMACFGTVVWHAGTNLAFSADKYRFTVLCKLCLPLLATGFLAATIIGFAQPFDMMGNLTGVPRVPEGAFAYRAALLVPGLVTTSLVFLAFGNEYRSEPPVDRTRRRRQYWFAAGALVWLLLTFEHLVFSYLNSFHYSLLSAAPVFYPLMLFEGTLYVLMALTWSRAITLDVAKKSEIQQRMDAGLRTQLHRISRRRGFVDLCDLYPDWSERVDDLMLALHVHGARTGSIPRAEPAIALFSELHLLAVTREQALPQRMACLIDEQRSELSALSGLSYGREDDTALCQALISGSNGIVLVSEPPYVQLTVIAAAYHGLLASSQTGGVLDGRLVDPRLLKLYCVAMERTSHDSYMSR